MRLSLDERERRAYITNTPLVASFDEIDRADELAEEVDYLKGVVRDLEDDIDRLENEVSQTT